MKMIKKSLKLIIQKQWFRSSDNMIQYCHYQLRYYLKNMNIQQYQTQIFQLNCDLERISILERKSRARLQIVHRHNMCYIRSINDKYNNIRILLLGLIINIYENHNIERLNKLKNIIYSSELGHLTVSRGLLKEQLHKNIGVHLANAQYGENIQNELIKCFNCVAFFDQVLVSSFKQFFVVSDGDSLKAWLQIISEVFEISIEILPQQHTSGKNRKDKKDSIWFQRGTDSIYLPSNHKEPYETDTIVDASLISMEEVEIQRGHNLMTVSIEDLESPCLQNKENTNRQNCQKDNSLEKTNCITPFQPKLQLLKSRKTRKNSFWTFFCCSVD